MFHISQYSSWFCYVWAWNYIARQFWSQTWLKNGLSILTFACGGRGDNPGTKFSKKNTKNFDFLMVFVNILKMYEKCRESRKIYYNGSGTIRSHFGSRYGQSKSPLIVTAWHSTCTIRGGEINLPDFRRTCIFHPRELVLPTRENLYFPPTWF